MYDFDSAPSVCAGLPNDQEAALDRNTVASSKKVKPELEEFTSGLQGLSLEEAIVEQKTCGVLEQQKTASGVGQQKTSGAVDCKNGASCVWKPRCRFGHPEGCNEPAGNRSFQKRRPSWRKSYSEDMPREMKPTSPRSPKMRRGSKDCRSGYSCNFKPHCLFYHREGGNDHVTAYANFTAKKGKEVREERTRAKQKVAKKVEKKFDWEGGSKYSNMLAWCDLAEKVNTESLDDVNGWILDKFLEDQVSLLGGDKDLYDKLDSGLRELQLLDGLVEEQRKLYNWRMDFFLDKFKSTYLGDVTSTWLTDGFDDNHCLDTIPMQVTTNFEEVMNLAATNRKMDEENERFFFAHDENLSYMADKMFGDTEDQDDLEDAKEAKEIKMMEKRLVPTERARVQTWG